MGGSPANVRAAQRPYLLSHGDLLKHQKTCTQVKIMWAEYKKRVAMAVKKDGDDEQLMAIIMALERGGYFA